MYQCDVLFVQLDDILKERRVELNQQHQRELERLKNKHQLSLLNIEEEYEDEVCCLFHQSV